MAVMVRVVPQEDLDLEGLSLDGFAVQRLSATLHHGSGDHPSTADSPWWIYLGCEPMPTRFDVGTRPLWVRASTTTGRRVQAQARIVGRKDGSWGTELILAGLPVATLQERTGV